MAAKHNPHKNGMYKGMPGVRKGIANRNTKRVFEIMEKLNFDPIETMCLFAMGDVVRLGLMTQVELEKPSRTVLIGKSKVQLPSGKQRALDIIPVPLRAGMASDVANYAYPKRSAVSIVDDEGNSVPQVVLYVPENNRRTDKAL